MPLLGLKGVIVVGAGIDLALAIALLARRASDPARPELRPDRRPAVAAGLVAAAAYAWATFGVALDPYKMASGVFRRGDLFRPRQWIPLYAAVAARDGTRMATLTEHLLANGRELTAGHWQYLLNTALSGRLMTGGYDAGIETWNRYVKEA